MGCPGARGRVQFSAPQVLWAGKKLGGAILHRDEGKDLKTKAPGVGVGDLTDRQVGGLQGPGVGLLVLGVWPEG